MKQIAIFMLAMLMMAVSSGCSTVQTLTNDLIYAEFGTLRMIENSSDPQAKAYKVAGYLDEMIEALSGDLVDIPLSAIESRIEEAIGYEFLAPSERVLADRLLSSLRDDLRGAVGASERVQTPEQAQAVRSILEGIRAKIVEAYGEPPG